MRGSRDHGITGPLLFAFSVFISCLVRGVWAGCFLARMRREKHSFRDILNNLPSGKVPAEVVLSFEVFRSLVSACTAFVVFRVIVRWQSSATTALCYVVSRERVRGVLHLTILQGICPAHHHTARLDGTPQIISTLADWKTPRGVNIPRVPFSQS